MRSDNVADYPWLSFAVSTVLDDYVRLREGGADEAARRPVVEALLNGLSADARAFIGDAPASLAACEAERGRFRETLAGFKTDLLGEFEACRPTPGVYSPLSFFFNFCYNVLKGTVVDSLIWGEARSISLNDMFSALPRDESSRAAAA